MFHQIRHLYAIKSAYDDGLDEAIITEDDINLKILNFTYDKLASLWSQSRDIEIIQLYSSGYEIIPKYIESIKKYNLQLIPKIYDYWGGCAYLINRKGMKNVLKYFDKTQNKFNLLDISLNEMLVADSFIYKSCNTMTSSLPFINILNPEKNESTFSQNVQNKEIIKIYKDILNQNNSRKNLTWILEEIWYANKNRKTAFDHFNWINNNINNIIKII